MKVKIKTTVLSGLIYKFRQVNASPSSVVVVLANQPCCICSVDWIHQATGEVWLKGQCLTHLNETKRGELRNRYLGFIYQFHHLLAEFNATENVALPLLMRRDVSIKQANRCNKCTASSGRTWASIASSTQRAVRW